jgi:hypothetical protein
MIMRFIYLLLALKRRKGTAADKASVLILNFAVTVILTGNMLGRNELCFEHPSLAFVSF